MSPLHLEISPCRVHMVRSGQYRSKVIREYSHPFYTDPIWWTIKSIEAVTNKIILFQLNIMIRTCKVGIGGGLVTEDTNDCCGVL